MGPAGAGAEPDPPAFSEPEPEPPASSDALPEPPEPEPPEPEPEPDAEPLPADPEPACDEPPEAAEPDAEPDPRRSRGASDLLSTGERRIHRRSRRCPGQRRNAQHAGARANAQSSRGIGRSGIGLRPFDRQGTHCARRVRRACLDLAHLAVEPQRGLQRDHHRAGLVAGNHGGDCRHVTADARNHQGERRCRKRHHGTGDSGLPPQPARAARRAIGCGKRGRRARGRADSTAGGRQLLSGRLRARRVSGSQIRRVAGGQVRRVVDCQVCRIVGGQVRRIASRQVCRVAGGQVRRIALVVVRILFRHRLPSFPCSPQKTPLCQAWPVLLAQSLVSGYCN